MTTCRECGFVYENCPAKEVTAEVASNVDRTSDVVLTALAKGGGAGRLGQRPGPATWSVLEYTAHVRDVLLVQRDRLVHALVVERPTFEPMHRDERPELVGYADEDLHETVAELMTAAALFNRLVDHMSAEQFERVCVYGFPEPAEQTLLWVARNTVHETKHHLADIQRGLTSLGGG